LAHKKRVVQDIRRLFDDAWSRLLKYARKIEKNGVRRAWEFGVMG
jgi:phosphatidylserine/phosphatidylglycerophosphate/cardiolipin synthase-like enzyme